MGLTRTKEMGSSRRRWKWVKRALTPPPDPIMVPMSGELYVRNRIFFFALDGDLG
jgi:hypothetical protein